MLESRTDHASRQIPRALGYEVPLRATATMMVIDIVLDATRTSSVIYV